MTDTLVAIDALSDRIHLVRGQRVMLDSDLAELYGVATKVFNQAIKRNLDRFPADFMFQLTEEEEEYLRSQIVTSNAENSLRSQFATSKPARGGRRYLPYVFTEHGAIQAANVLASVQAVEMGIYVVRAFVKLREAAIEHRDLSRRLDVLEEKTEALAMDHESFSRNTRVQLKQVFDAIRELMTPPDPPKRPIGFVTQESKTKKAQVRRKS